MFFLCVVFEDLTTGFESDPFLWLRFKRNYGKKTPIRYVRTAIKVSTLI